MSEPNNELLAALQGLLAKSSGPTAPASPTGWAQPQPTAALVQGVGVPIKIHRGRGTLRVHLWLPAECAASPSALNAALDDLERAGLPLDTYEPRESGWGNAGWGNNHRNWRR